MIENSRIKKRKLKKIKAIISGGGTGGHIYPALAVANELKKCSKAHDLLFVGAQGKMEMQHVPAAGYPIVGLWISGIQRKKFLKNVLFPLKLIVSLGKARKIIRNFQPDVVVGTGGYASGTIVYVATQMKIPTLILEQNSFAGLTNKLLAKWVDKICVAYEHMDQYFSAEKMVLTGNPVRSDISKLTKRKQAALAYFGLQPEKKCLLVLGGSLGSRTINESILQAMPTFSQAGIQLIWQTGHLYHEEVKVQCTKANHRGIAAYPFLERIDLAYAAADVVIARAGALTIAELCLAQKPVIFVPSPNVTEDHQTKNVQPLVDQGAALLMKDEVARQKLGEKTMQLLRDKARQKELAHRIARFAKPNAIHEIVGEIIRLARV